MACLTSARVRAVLRGTFFLSIGAITLAFGGIWGDRQRSFLARASLAEGVVSDLYSGAAHLLISFSDKAGQTYDFYTSGWISYRKGQRVRVLYLPDNPKRSAQLDDAGALWFTPLLLGMLGLLHVSAGVYIIARRKKEKTDA